MEPITWFILGSLAVLVLLVVFAYHRGNKEGFDRGREWGRIEGWNMRHEQALTEEAEAKRDAMRRRVRH